MIAIKAYGKEQGTMGTVHFPWSECAVFKPEKEIFKSQGALSIRMDLENHNRKLSKIHGNLPVICTLQQEHRKSYNKLSLGYFLMDGKVGNIPIFKVLSPFVL